MREIGRDGDDVTVSVTVDELRAVGGTLLEALDGGYAFPGDAWEELVGHPREYVQRVLDDVMHALDA